jgi:hypothetical protein
MQKIILLLIVGTLLTCRAMPPAPGIMFSEVGKHDEQKDKNLEHEDIALNDDLERGAVFGHSSIAANPHISKDEYLSTSHIQHGIHSQEVKYLQDEFPHLYNQAPKAPKIPYMSVSVDYQNAKDLKEALRYLNYVKNLIAGHTSYMKNHKCSQSTDSSHHPSSDKESCDPALWRKCNCISPAEYSVEGRGNCNLGAAKPDVQVWCYVDPHNGDPATVCPDSKPSKTKPGHYWSRFACIT